VSEAVPENMAISSSHADLAGKAAQLALDEIGGASVAGHIDTVAAVRTFADSVDLWACPFGSSNNFPRSVAKRIGADPKTAVYEAVGGQTPQLLVGEYCEKLARGEAEMVLIAGGEAIANTRAAAKATEQPNWQEEIAGQLEDRGGDEEVLYSDDDINHGVAAPMQFYGLMENARRAQLGLSQEQYATEMGDCFAAISAVAANNPLSLDRNKYDAATLVTPTEKNALMVTPYTKHLIAKDRVNQAAALILTTVAKAEELGIPESQWVYLHGYANTSERKLLERPNIAHSEGMKQALLGALSCAGKSANDIGHFDIYSCFPIVVLEARDILGISKDDPRPLSQTGGLPFFGGPGNNYTTHGIAELVNTLRKHPGSFGMAYGNGGWMSKHACGIYSTQAPAGEWQPCDSTALQESIYAAPVTPIERQANGEAVVESYIVNYHRGTPLNCVVIARANSNGKRLYARSNMGEQEAIDIAMAGDVVGRTITVTANENDHHFAFA
ncbi:MAG: hypothetical protein ACSHWQ_03895, partial [Spongiibacteraceae bacterium]